MTYLNPDGTIWEPEFEGQRPPFQAGNQIAVKHGAFTPGTVDPLAVRYVDAMMDDGDLPPMIRAPYFREAVYGYCLARAKRDLIAAWIANMPIQSAADSDRGKTPPLELLRKWESTVDNKAKALGLTPAAWVRIHRDLAGAHQADAVTLLTEARRQAELGNRKPRNIVDGSAADVVGDPPTPPFG